MRKSGRLVLLRHGESEFNLKNLFCGWHDTPLSKLGTLRQVWHGQDTSLLIQLLTRSIGIEQSHKIAAAKIIEAKLVIDKVFCSVLRRSLHTAELILEDMECSNVPIVKDWRLCERHYGNLTGFNKRQMADMYGEEQVQAWRRGYDNIPPPINLENEYYHEIMKNPAFKDVPADEFPRTESMHMCVGRVKPAWEEIKKEILQGTRPMIIAHGTVARALIMHIEGKLMHYIAVCSGSSISFQFPLSQASLKKR